MAFGAPARGPARPPLARSLSEALQAAPTVASVLAGHREAQACYALIEPLLPSGLASQLRPGPLEAGTWTIFAAGNASAAKARQLLPRLAERLREVRSDVQAVKVKIVPRGEGPQPPGSVGGGSRYPPR